MADILTKAINDLAHALKGRRNTKGIMESEALQKLDELLNQAPQAQTPPSRQVPREEATTPRVTNPVDKPTPKVINPVNMPTPRADATIPHKNAKEMSQERAKMHHLIHAATNSRARIPQRHQMNLCQSKCNKQAQLIHDKETGEFLNYRKLLCDPKHKETWEKSAANEFGQLAQGLKNGRVKGTNTTFFISKDKFAKDRAKDITYGSFRCNLKPNKTETHRTRLTTGE